MKMTDEHKELIEDVYEQCIGEPLRTVARAIKGNFPVTLKDITYNQVYHYVRKLDRERIQEVLEAPNGVKVKIMFKPNQRQMDSWCNTWPKAMDRTVGQVRTLRDYWMTSNERRLESRSNGWRYPACCLKVVSY